MATGLDELPQFINILRGDMSAVGPRPLTEDDVRRFGWVSSNSPAAALELDRAYLAHRGLRLDCRCIALSFAVNVFGKARVRAYLALRPVAGRRIEGPSTSAR